MLRILYVEDNAANLSLVHRVARVGGHEVVNRTSGEATLRDFASIKPDLVLMDIQLEGAMSGLDVVRKLRADGYTDIPIVAVTAYAMKGDKEKSLAAGCDSYLPKPLPITELVALIDKYQHEAGKRKTSEVPKVTPSETPATESKTSETPPQAEAVTKKTTAPAISEPATTPMEASPIEETPSEVVVADVKASPIAAENSKTAVLKDSSADPKTKHAVVETSQAIPITATDSDSLAQAPSAEDSQGSGQNPESQSATVE